MACMSGKSAGVSVCTAADCTTHTLELHSHLILEVYYNVSDLSSTINH